MIDQFAQIQRFTARLQSGSVNIEFIEAQLKKFAMIQEERVIAFLNHEFFIAEHNLLKYLSSALQKQPIKSEPVRRQVYKFLSQYIRTHSIYLLDDIKYIYSQLLSMFWREQGKIKQYSILPIVAIINAYESELLLNFEILKPQKLHNSIVTLLQTQKKSHGVIGQCWHLISLIQNKFPKLINPVQKKKVQQTSFLQLQKYVNSDKNLNTIASLLRALSKSLKEVYLGQNSIEELFKYTHVLIRPLKATYSVPIAALELLQERRELFRTNLMFQCKKIFLLLRQNSNHKSRQYSSKCQQVLLSINEQITKQIQNNKQKYKNHYYFIRNQLSNDLQLYIGRNRDEISQQEKNAALSLIVIVKLLGIISKLYMTYDGKQQFQNLFKNVITKLSSKMLSNTELIYGQNLSKSQFYKILKLNQQKTVAILNTLSQMAQHIINIQDNLLQKLKEIFIQSAKKLNHYKYKQYQNLLKSIVKFFIALYSKFQKKWSKIIIQYIQQSIQKLLFIEKEEENKYEQSVITLMFNKILDRIQPQQIKSFIFSTYENILVKFNEINEDNKINRSALFILHDIHKFINKKKISLSQEMMEKMRIFLDKLINKVNKEKDIDNYQILYLIYTFPERIYSFMNDQIIDYYMQDLIKRGLKFNSSKLAQTAFQCMKKLFSYLNIKNILPFLSPHIKGDLGQNILQFLGTLGGGCHYLVDNYIDYQKNNIELQVEIFNQRYKLDFGKIIPQKITDIYHYTQEKPPSSIDFFQSSMAQDIFSIPKFKPDQSYPASIAPKLQHLTYPKVQNSINPKLQNNSVQASENIANPIEIIKESLNFYGELIKNKRIFGQKQVQKYEIELKQKIVNLKIKKLMVLAYEQICNRFPKLINNDKFYQNIETYMFDLRGYERQKILVGFKQYLIYLLEQQQQLNIYNDRIDNFIVKLKLQIMKFLNDQDQKVQVQLINILIICVNEKILKSKIVNQSFYSIVPRLIITNEVVSLKYYQLLIKAKHYYTEHQNKFKSAACSDFLEFIHKKIIEGLGSRYESSYQYLIDHIQEQIKNEAKPYLIDHFKMIWNKLYSQEHEELWLVNVVKLMIKYFTSHQTIMRYAKHPDFASQIFLQIFKAFFQKISADEKSHIIGLFVRYIKNSKKCEHSFISVMQKCLIYIAQKHRYFIDISMRAIAIKSNTVNYAILFTQENIIQGQEDAEEVDRIKVFWQDLKMFYKYFNVEDLKQNKFDERQDNILYEQSIKCFAQLSKWEDIRGHILDSYEKAEKKQQYQKGIICLLKENQNEKAKFHAFNAFQLFKKQWQQVSSFAFNSKHQLLQQVQKNYQLIEFLEVYKKPEYIQSQITQLYKKWSSRPPSEIFDDNITWNQILSSRMIYAHMFSYRWHLPLEGMTKNITKWFVQVVNGIIQKDMLSTAELVIKKALKFHKLSKQFNWQLYDSISRLKLQQLKKRQSIILDEYQIVSKLIQKQMNHFKNTQLIDRYKLIKIKNEFYENYIQIYLNKSQQPNFTFIKQKIIVIKQNYQQITSQLYQTHFNYALFLQNILTIIKNKEIKFQIQLGKLFIKEIQYCINIDNSNNQQNLFLIILKLIKILQEEYQYIGQDFQVLTSKKTFPKWVFIYFLPLFIQNLNSQKISKYLKHIFYDLLKQYPQAIIYPFNSSFEERKDCKTQLAYYIFKELRNKKIKYFQFIQNLFLINKSQKLVKLSAQTTWFADYSNSGRQQIQIPGGYSNFKKPEVWKKIYIDKFYDEVLTLASIRKPKRIKTLGSDGKVYMFLVKGGEDIRLDQRIEHLFELFNRILKDKTQLQINRFQVIPMKPMFGIFEWVSNSQTLKNFFQNDLQMLTNEGYVQFYKYLKKICPNVDDRHVWHRTLMVQSQQQVVKNMNRCCSKVPYGLLRFGLQKISKNYDSFLFLKNNFIANYSIICLATYIFGIGDRHLQNFLIQTTTGKLFMIDFGYSFCTSIELAIPQLIPFRLTKCFKQVCDPIGLNGPFKKHFMSSYEILKKKMKLIINYCQVFIDDPLIERTQKKKTFSNKIKIVQNKLNGFNPRFILQQLLSDSRHKSTNYFQFLKKAIWGKCKNKNRHLSTQQLIDELILLATDRNVTGRSYIGLTLFV